MNIVSKYFYKDPLKFLIVIFFSLIPISLIIMSGLNGFPKQDDIQPCKVGHIGNVEQLNEYDKVTYNIPKMICDIRIDHQVKDSNAVMIELSYNYKQKYHKLYTYWLEDCGKSSSDNINFDNKTGNFICQNGDIAKEYRAF